jgi:hypothetical protein
MGVLFHSTVSTTEVEYDAGMFMNTDLESMWNEEEVSFVSTFI